jgi:hypothetical protein
MRYLVLIVLLAGCSSQPKQPEPMLSYEELSEMIQVTRAIRIPATGEYCVIEGDKIISCRPGPKPVFAETEE